MTSQSSVWLCSAKGIGLHMVDGLETARVFSITKVGPDKDEFLQCLTEWAGLMVMLNELNRSVSRYDAYPFFLSERIATKLHFVHRIIHALQKTRGFPVGPQDAG